MILDIFGHALIFSERCRYCVDFAVRLLFVRFLCVGLAAPIGRPVIAGKFGFHSENIIRVHCKFFFTIPAFKYSLRRRETCKDPCFRHIGAGLFS